MKEDSYASLSKDRAYSDEVPAFLNEDPEEAAAF